MSTIFYLALAILLLYLLWEYQRYKNITFYTKQGLRYKLYPLILEIFTKTQQDPFEAAQKLTSLSNGADLALTNVDGEVQICPLTPKALKEFFNKEEEHTTRRDPDDPAETSLNFDGKPSRIAREIFKKLYGTNSLGLFRPVIAAVIRRQIRFFKQWIDSVGQYGVVEEVDLRSRFTSRLFDDMTNNLVFGDSFKQLCIPELDNKSFYRAMMKSQELSWDSENRFDDYTWGLWTEFGLNKQYNDYVDIRERLEVFVYKVYDQRMKEVSIKTYTPQRNNILDLLILENQERKKQKKESYSRKDIYMHIVEFSTEGIDSIQSLLEGLIFHLLLEKNHQFLERLKRIIKEKLTKNYSTKTLIEEPFLEAVLLESIRVFPGQNRSFSKRVVKPFELCGVKIRKGDDVAIMYASMNYCENTFDNPYQFNPNRFIESKPPRLAFLPFSHGPRSCVGRSFGEFAVKLILVEMLKEFDLSVDPEFELEAEHSYFISWLTDYTVNVKKLKR